MRPYLLLIAAALAAGFCLTPWGRVLDYATYDTFFKLRGPQPIQEDIVFVAIDETSFQEIGLQWPWPRALHARLLENVFRAGAKVVVIDILFSEPSTPEDDSAFAAALNTYGTTILAADINRSEDNRFVVENNIRPLDSFLTPLTRVGHIRTPSDPDGFVRRTDLVLRDLKSLGYMAALAYTDGNCCQELPDEELPLINFSGGPDTVNTISYYQALEPARYLPPDFLQGKLVIVGVNTTSSAMPDERRPDHFPTPYTRWGTGYTPGSLVHANVAANLLTNHFLKSVSITTAAGCGFLLAAAFGFLTINLSFRTSTTIAVITTAIISLTSFWLFTQHLTYLSPMVLLAPLLAAYLVSPYYRYLVEARQRAFIRKAFSTYVNPAIVDQLEKDPDSVKLGGKQVEGTALFVDIAGFTSLTERNDPQTVVTFINEFLSALIDIAMESGGTVERFLGDAIMVIWGAPTKQDNHAQLACRAAIAMMLEIERISATESERLGTRIHARFGINSGRMTAGNIGANRRFNYTVLGDCVNLSARLEGLNKIYQSTVIIGAATAAQLDAGFVLRYLDTVTVRGRKHPENVFELLGMEGKIAQAKLRAVDAYATGIALYQQRKWMSARDCFAAGLEIDINDGPCAALKARCEDFFKNEPAADWDGVFEVRLK
jgi:adenylate cyclase